MRCQLCGSTNPDGAQFCGSCGGAFGIADQPTVQQMTPAVTQFNTPGSEPNYAAPAPRVGGGRNAAIIAVGAVVAVAMIVVSIVAFAGGNDSSSTPVASSTTLRGNDEAVSTTTTTTDDSSIALEQLRSISIVNPPDVISIGDDIAIEYRASGSAEGYRVGLEVDGVMQPDDLVFHAVSAGVYRVRVCAEGVATSVCSRLITLSVGSGDGYPKDVLLLEGKFIVKLQAAQISKYPTDADALREYGGAVSARTGIDLVNLKVLSPVNYVFPVPNKPKMEDCYLFIFAGPYDTEQEARDFAQLFRDYGSTGAGQADVRGPVSLRPYPIYDASTSDGNSCP